jgi:Flp pilus assembly protein protease CpaA
LFPARGARNGTAACAPRSRLFLFSTLLAGYYLLAVLAMEQRRNYVLPRSAWTPRSRLFLFRTLLAGYYLLAVLAMEQRRSYVLPRSAWTPRSRL